MNTVLSLSRSLDVCVRRVHPPTNPPAIMGLSPPHALGGVASLSRALGGSLPRALGEGSPPSCLGV